MNLEEISKLIDAGDNPDAIRHALGEKIMECLVARGHELTSWESLNFGIAIELLHSPYLRMTWWHVDFVCTGSDGAARARMPPESQKVPSLDELHIALREALAASEDRRLRPRATGEGDELL